MWSETEPEHGKIPSQIQILCFLTMMVKITFKIIASTWKTSVVAR